MTDVMFLTSLEKSEHGIALAGVAFTVVVLTELPSHQATHGIAGETLVTAEDTHLTGFHFPVTPVDAWKILLEFFQRLNVAQSNVVRLQTFTNLDLDVIQITSLPVAPCHTLDNPRIA